MPSDPPADVPAFVPEALAELQIEIGDDELAQHARFLDHLLAENRKFNLTGIRDRDEAWRRHILDSLTLLPALTDLSAAATVVDVGTGGGLPGVPLAIALPHLRFTLMEVTAKKVRFLEGAVAMLKLTNVEIVSGRAETLGHDRRYRERFDAAVCRALGPMRELLEYTLPLVRSGGMLLAMKGPSVETELADAGDALHMLGAGELQVIDAYPATFENRSVIIQVEKAGSTPRSYPRPPGTPRHAPL